MSADPHPTPFLQKLIASSSQFSSVVKQLATAPTDITLVSQVVTAIEALLDAMKVFNQALR